MRFLHPVVATAVAGGLLLVAPTAQAEDAASPASAAKADNAAAVSFDARAIRSRLHSATEELDGAERAAVASYLKEEADAGRVLDERDLKVATLFSDDFVVNLVQPEQGIEVEEVRVTSDAATGDITAAASTQATEATAPAAQAGPGMGTWPSWDDAFHASVRLVVYYKNGTGDGGYYKIGDAVFQTVRRKYQNDDNTSIDTWQIGRHGVGRPDNDLYKVKKIWASQQLTDAAQSRAKEWIWKRTNPEAGFTNCTDNGTLTLGWVSIGLRDCSEYDVWTGAVGHQRMYYDQGTWSGTGQRSIAYTSGFTIANGVFPEATWYEFVTFSDHEISSAANKLKCTSTARGPQNDTTSYQCYFVVNGDYTKEAG